MCAWRRRDDGDVGVEGDGHEWEDLPPLSDDEEEAG